MVCVWCVCGVCVCVELNILGQMREHMACQRIRQLWWIDTRDMSADGLNKGALSRRALLRALTKGEWTVIHPSEKKLSKGMMINEQFETDGDHFVRRALRLYDLDLSI